MENGMWGKENIYVCKEIMFDEKEMKSKWKKYQLHVKKKMEVKL